MFWWSFSLHHYNRKEALEGIVRKNGNIVIIFCKDVIDLSLHFFNNDVSFA